MSSTNSSINTTNGTNKITTNTIKTNKIKIGKYTFTVLSDDKLSIKKDSEHAVVIDPQTP